MFEQTLWICNLHVNIHQRVIPLTLLYLIKPLQRINLYIKTSWDVCSNLQIMHHNICDFTKSISTPLLIVRNPRHMNIWLWRSKLIFVFLETQVAKHQRLTLIEQLHQLHLHSQQNNILPLQPLKINNKNIKH